MLSLNECKKILATDALELTDEEIILIRDWLYHISDIAIDVVDNEKKQTESDVKQIK